MSVEHRVVDPATGQVEKECPTATGAEIESAVARVHAGDAARAVPVA